MSADYVNLSRRAPHPVLDQIERASRFRALHEGQHVFVIPNP